MFILRVHVDTKPSLTGVDGGATTFADSSTANLIPNNQQQHWRSKNRKQKIQQQKGIVQLFRSVLPHQQKTTPLLFVLAVPNYFSSDSFIRFCGSYLNQASEILFFRNDATTSDRYSVLIKIFDQKRAESFYHNFNGKRFLSTEVEVCHILFTGSVEYCESYGESIEIVHTAPTGFVELPTCPVCLERLDENSSGMLMTLYSRTSKWTNSSCLVCKSVQVCRFCQQQAEKPTCYDCGTSDSLYICLICGVVGCARYKNGHAMQHWTDTQHSYTLDLETQNVWDYVDESYVHRLNQSQTDGKLVELNSCCRLTDGDYGTDDYSDDSEITGDHFCSKDKAIIACTDFLQRQLESQREHYETLLLEAKGKREESISEAVEKAVNSKLQDIQIKLQKCVEKAVNSKLQDIQLRLEKCVAEVVNSNMWDIQLKVEKFVGKAVNSNLQDIQRKLETCVKDTVNSNPQDSRHGKSIEDYSYDYYCD